MIGRTYTTAWSDFMTPKNYSSNYGLACGAHDMGTKACQAGGKSAGANWCSEPWCYMTNSDCYGTVKTSFFKGTALKDSLYYSYPKCNGEDHFSNFSSSLTSCSSMCPKSNGGNGGTGNTGGTGGCNCQSCSVQNLSAVENAATRVLAA